jgi:transposase InsO family protein
MDFIVKLPKTRKGNKYIWVVIDRFTKLAHFILLPNSKALERAKKFLKQIWRLYGIPNNIISDRDSLFMGHWWQSFCKLLKVKTQLLRAFHPEMDGQTKRINQIVEQFLRMFATKKDWDKVLPLAEFEYNNSKHSGIQYSIFYATYRYNLKLIWPLIIKNTRNLTSQLYTHYLEKIHNQL